MSGLEEVIKRIDDFTFRKDISEALNDKIRELTCKEADREYVRLNELLDLIAAEPDKNRLYLKAGEVSQTSVLLKQSDQISTENAGRFLRALMLSEPERMPVYLERLESSLQPALPGLEEFLESKAVNGQISLPELITLLYSEDNSKSAPSARATLMKNRFMEGKLPREVAEKLSMPESPEKSIMVSVENAKDVLLYCSENSKNKDYARQNILQNLKGLTTQTQATYLYSFEPAEEDYLQKYVEHKQNNGLVFFYDIVKLMYEDTTPQKLSQRVFNIKRGYYNGNLPGLEGMLKVRPVGAIEKLAVKSEDAQEVIEYFINNYAKNKNTQWANIRKNLYNFYYGQKGESKQTREIFDSALRDKINTYVEHQREGNYMPCSDVIRLLYPEDVPPSQISPKVGMLKKKLKEGELKELEDALKIVAKKKNERLMVNVLHVPEFLEHFMSYSPYASLCRLSENLDNYLNETAKTDGAQPSTEPPQILSNKRFNVNDATKFLFRINPYLKNYMVRDIIDSAKEAGQKEFTPAALIDLYLQMDEENFRYLRQKEQFPYRLNQIIDYVDRRTLKENLSQDALKENQDLGKFILSNFLSSEYVFQDSTQYLFCRASFDKLKEFLNTPLLNIPEYQPPTWMLNQSEYTDLQGAAEMLGINFSRIGKYINKFNLVESEGHNLFSVSELLDMKNKELRVKLEYE